MELNEARKSAAVPISLFGVILQAKRVQLLALTLGVPFHRQLPKRIARVVTRRVRYWY